MSKKERTVVKYTDDKGNKIKSVERRSGKRVETIKSKDGNYKSRQVTGKDGKVKKTVTRTPGGVEKEIERGNKRIEVKKFKDEGVKTRTVINMKKNDKYKDDLKNSTFKNMPKQMFDNANSSKNTQIDGKISESKPLTTPQKKLMNVHLPYEMLKGTLDKMSTEGGFKTTPKTGKITKNK
jgi:hypothetical protein